MSELRLQNVKLPLQTKLEKYGIIGAEFGARPRAGEFALPLDGSPCFRFGGPLEEANEIEWLLLTSLKEGQATQAGKEVTLMKRVLLGGVLVGMSALFAGQAWAAAPIPEASALSLWGVGCLALILLEWYRRRK